jgi:hypothetical protein
MKNSSTKAKVLEVSFIKKANAGMGRSDTRETGKRFNYDFIGKNRQTKEREDDSMLKNLENYGPILVSLLINVRIFFGCPK